MFFYFFRLRFASLALLRVVRLVQMGTFQTGAHCLNSPLKSDVPLYEVCKWVILALEIVTRVGRQSESSGIVFALSLTSPVRTQARERDAIQRVFRRREKAASPSAAKICQPARSDRPDLSLTETKI